MVCFVRCYCGCDTSATETNFDCPKAFYTLHRVGNCWNSIYSRTTEAPQHTTPYPCLSRPFSFPVGAEWRASAEKYCKIIRPNIGKESGGVKLLSSRRKVEKLTANKFPHRSRPTIELSLVLFFYLLNLQLPVNLLLPVLMFSFLISFPYRTSLY